MGTRSRQWSAPTRPAPHHQPFTLITQHSWCGQVTISLLLTLLLSSSSCSVLTSYFYHEFAAFILAKSYRNNSCGSENGLWTLKESFTNCNNAIHNNAEILWPSEQSVFLTYLFSILFVKLSLMEKRVDQSLQKIYKMCKCIFLLPFQYDGYLFENSFIVILLFLVINYY